MAVTPSTIAVDLGEAAPETGTLIEEQWSLWIADARLLIENRRALLPPKPIDAATLDYVIRKAVVAHVRKPDDATQVTVAVDDGSTARRYESSKGRVVILDEWWDELGLTLKSENAPFTIRPAGRIPDRVIW